VDAFQLNTLQAAALYAAASSVVAADGPAQAPGRALLESLAWALALASAEECSVGRAAALVAEAFPEVRHRTWIVETMLIAACTNGEVTVAGEAAVLALARSLQVSSHWIALVSALRARRVFAVKRQLMQRSPDAKRMFSRIWQEDGALGLWQAVLFVLGVFRDPALAARFHALGTLPQGTFGRQLFDQHRERGLTFPGERSGIPERMMHHDLMHILNDYGTDASGECEIAGFYTGFSHGDRFTFMVVALATFQLGMAVSPAVVSKARGTFDPERVLAAFLRGRQLRVDVMGPWNYWQLMPLSIGEARKQLGINA
jgi:hypothetical protein